MINPSLQGQKHGQEGQHGSPGAAGQLSGGGSLLNPWSQGWLLLPPCVPEQPLYHCPESWKQGKNNTTKGYHEDLRSAGPCFIAQA